MKPKSLLQFLLGLALLCTSCGPVLSEQERAALQSTKAAEISLTSVYGAEARTAIENYEAKWMSLEAYKNPSIQAELETGPSLEYWGFARMGQSFYDEPWLISKSALVTYIRVLEYAPERFKAIASVVRQFDEVTPEGNLNKSLPPEEVCRLYIFVREDNIWKVADLFDMTEIRDVERDWFNRADWSKQIMGDLPREDCYGNSLR